MKLKCEGCRAIQLPHKNGKCILGYKIMSYPKAGTNNIYYRPIEECPKPKNWKDFEHAEIKQ